MKKHIIHITIIGIFCFSHTAFALEPIGTIGQPLPEQHVFLSNETLLRVVPTHIQVVNPYTNEVIDEFGERIYEQTHISHVIISPTAEHLAILNASVDPKITTVNIWDVNAREQISEWNIAGIIRLAAFSPTAPLFAISYDDEIQLWNWQTGAFIGKMIGQRRPWEQCHPYKGGTICSSYPRDHASVFTPDGRYLIVASTRPDVELWNIETRRLQAYFEGHTGNWVEEVVISPDGTRLATFEDGWDEIYVWDTETQQLLWQERSRVGSISSMVFSPDSQHLYVASRTDTFNWSGQGPWEGWDDQVSIWDVESGKQIDTLGDDFYILDAIAISPDGKTLLLHYRDAVVIWDIQSKQSLNVWTDFVFYTSNNMLSPDGQTFVSVSHYFIKTWDVPSREMRLLTSAESSFFREFAISGDGQKIAIGRDPWIEGRNLHTGAVETQFQYNYGHSDVAFSSTGRWVTARGAGFIFLFDLENPERIQKLSAEGKPNIYDSLLFTFSENDEYLAASIYTYDNHARQYWIVLWKRETDTFIFQYAWQVPELWSSHHSRPAFASAADGSPVLAVPREHDTQIWKLLSERPELLTTLDVGFPVHFSPDGRYLFADQDYNLQVWNWQTETQLNHASISEYFDVSQDGTILLSYADTGQIQIWDGKALLPSQSVAVEPQDKQIVILGAIKRNQLLQNFPNPFNPETWIPFRLANESDVTIHIYAPTGQLVRRLSPGIIPAGDYSSQSEAIYWDGRNQTGESVSSGIYLYTIDAGDFSATRKMLIRK